MIHGPLGVWTLTRSLEIYVMFLSCAGVLAVRLSEHTGDELAVVGQVSNGHNDYVTEVDGIPTTRSALGYTIQICRI